MTPCLFCQIVWGEAPATVVRDERHALAIVPLKPVTEGHLLVLPKRHIRDFTKQPGVSVRAFVLAAHLARDIGGPMNLITSKGTEATQSVFHLHFHLIPRTQDDGLALPWYSGKGNHR